MKRPNFFIIGAPKCGTTSLAHWLGQHPNIFMSPAKEPYFYNTDMDYYTEDMFDKPGRSVTEYLALFEGAADEHLAVGEASTWYLYSQVAVDNILNENPAARLIVSLRNPVDMVISLHNHNVMTYQENLVRLEDAWRAQDERRSERNVPPGCLFVDTLLYGSACALGSQLERLLQIAPRGNVKIIFLEDMDKDPRRTYLEILDFLDIPYDRRRDYSAKNRAADYRSWMLWKGMYLAGRAKERLGIPRLNLGMMQRVANLNRREIKPARCDPAFIDEYLRPYFAHEITLVERIAGRRLEHWKGATEAAAEKPSGEETSGLRL